MANTPPVKSVNSPEKVDPAHTSDQADAAEIEDADVVDDGLDHSVLDVFGRPYDIYEQYISYEEVVPTTVKVRNPDTGKIDSVQSTTIKTHLVPLSRWAAYERAHFGVK